MGGGRDNLAPRDRNLTKNIILKHFAALKSSLKARTFSYKHALLKKKSSAARIGQLWHLLSIHLNVTMVWFLTLEFRRNRPCKTLPATHCTGKLTVACTQCHAKMLPNLQRPVVSLTGHNFVAKISITIAECELTMRKTVMMWSKCCCGEKRRKR